MNINIVLLLTVLWTPMLVFSQVQTLDSCTNLSMEEQNHIRWSDDSIRRIAFNNPKTKVIIDTLDSDSLLQFFYPNGKLYFQVTFKNGMENGWREDYFPNGQLECKHYYMDGKVIFDSCNYISYDRFGNINYTSHCFLYNNKIYTIGITNTYDGIPFVMHIYEEHMLIGEFRYHKDRGWEIYNYHIKTLSKAKRIAKRFLATSVNRCSNIQNSSP